MKDNFFYLRLTLPTNLVPSSNVTLVLPETPVLSSGGSTTGGAGTTSLKKNFYTCKNVYRVAEDFPLLNFTRPTTTTTTTSLLPRETTTTTTTTVPLVSSTSSASDFELNRRYPSYNGFFRGGYPTVNFDYNVNNNWDFSAGDNRCVFQLDTDARFYQSQRFWFLVSVDNPDYPLSIYDVENEWKWEYSVVDEVDGGTSTTGTGAA
eukprot:GSA120T00013552001.1